MNVACQQDIVYCTFLCGG